MRITLTVISAGIAAAIAIAGCDTDDVLDAAEQLLPDAGAGGPVMVDLSPADDTTVGDLTDDEKVAICEEAADAVNAALSDADRCDLTAAIGSVSAIADGIEGVRARCAEILDPCITAARAARAAGQTPPDAPLEECAFFQGDVEGCPVTVAKLETCLQDVAVVAVETGRALDCSILSVDGALEAAKGLGEALPNTAACVEVQQACPGIFEVPEPDGGLMEDAGVEDAGAADEGAPDEGMSELDAGVDAG